MSPAPPTPPPSDSSNGADLTAVAVASTTFDGLPSLLVRHRGSVFVVAEVAPTNMVVVGRAVEDPDDPDESTYLVTELDALWLTIPAADGGPIGVQAAEIASWCRRWGTFPPFPGRVVWRRSPALGSRGGAQPG